MSDDFADPTPSPDIREDRETRADVPRDRWKRYLMPRPGTEGSKTMGAVSHTRVSTIAESLIQKKNLESWNQDRLMEGLAKSPELVKAIAHHAANQALDPATRKKRFREIAEEAITRGGGKERSSLGTAMHDFTERVNRGEDLTHDDMPEQHRVDLDAYQELIDRYGITILPEYLERVVNCYGAIQGTTDNIVLWQNPNMAPEPGAPGELEMRVADLKTGRDLTHGWVEKCIQLWLYANASHIWNADTQLWEPMPAGLRKDRALILHVPMNGTATLYDVDISGVGAWVDAAILARRINGEAPLRAHVVGTVDLRAGAYQAPAMAPGSAANSVQHGQVAIAPDVAQKLQDTIQSAQEQLAFTPAGPATVKLNQVVEVGTVGGTGKPLAPLAEPGKKGCSVCRRTGHRKGSPVCLGENDPGLSTGEATDLNAPEPGDFTQVAPGNDPALSKVFNGQGTAGVDFPHAPGCLLDPERWPHSTCPNPGDRCSCVNPTGWVTRSDGKFVHGACGLLSVPPPTSVQMSKQEPLAPGSASTRIPRPDPEPKLSDPASTVEPTAPPTSSWPSAPVGDWVLKDIAEAKTSSAVLAIRTQALNTGAWMEDKHAGPGYTRWNELQMEGK